MSQIILTIPDETLRALKVNPDQLGAEVRLAAAMKFYELGRLSSGAAASLAGISRTVFLTQLAEYGVDTFHLTDDELTRETRLGTVTTRVPKVDPPSRSLLVSERESLL